MAKQPEKRKKFQLTRKRSLQNPSLMNRLIDFPYQKLFGRRGQIIIASIFFLFLIVKFVTGLNSVSLQPESCKLSFIDLPYALFHQDRIISNTRISFQTKLIQNQTKLRQINDGRSPFRSVTDGNTVRARKINTDKFVWRALRTTLKNENHALAKCLGRLSNYQF